MSEHSDKPGDLQRLRRKIIGLGEESIQKSYYPALQQKLAELRESETRLQTIFNSVNDAIFVNDPTDGSIIAANQRACELYEYTVEELLSLTVGDISSGEVPYTQEHALELMKAAAEGQPQVSEWQAKSKSGRLFWIEVNLRHAMLGDKLRVLVVARDITDRMMTEEALKQSEKRYRSVVELIPAGVVVHADYKVLYANPAAIASAKLRDLSEMIGRPIWDFIAPQYREVYKNRYSRLLNGENQISLLEAVLQDKNGNPVEVEGIATLIDFDGKIAILSMFNNITERKRAERTLRESEEQFRALFEMANDAIFLMDKELFIACNDKTLDIFGCKTREEIIGHSPAEFSPELQPSGKYSRDEVTEHVAQTLAGKPQFFEWQHVRCDGSFIDVEVNMQAIDIRGKRIIQAIVRDITARKQVEAEKKAFYRQTILAATSGTLSVCDARDVEPYLQETQLCWLVNEAADVAQARKSIEAAFRVLGLDEELISSFKIGVGEALTNAVKHAPQGKVCAGKSDDETWVAVADNGPGIGSLILPQAILQRGFSTKPSLGLGYSIMLESADRILLKTDENGTTVVLFKKMHAAPISLNNVPDTWAGIPDSI